MVLNMIQYEWKKGEWRIKHDMNEKRVKHEGGSNARSEIESTGTLSCNARLDRNKSTRVTRSEDGRVVEQRLRKWDE